MKLIPLTQGKFAQVDDEDYECLMQFKWHAHKRKSNYYAIKTLPRTRLNGRRFQGHEYMHRFILGLKKGDKEYGDHVDRDGLNNQRSNLRRSTASGNAANRSPNGKSKYLGVHKAKTERIKRDGTHYRYDYFMATIRIGGKKCYIGSYKNEKDAAAAYNKVAIKAHGEFANLNKYKNKIL